VIGVGCVRKKATRKGVFTSGEGDGKPGKGVRLKLYGDADATPKRSLLNKEFRAKRRLSPKDFG